MLFISQETICVLLDITSRGGGRVELKTWSCVFSFNNQTSLSCQHWPMRGQVRGHTGQWEASERDGDNTPARPGTNSDFHHHCWPSQTIINGNASWRMFLFCHNGDNFPAVIRSPPREAGPAPRLLIIRNFKAPAACRAPGGNSTHSPVTLKWVNSRIRMWKKCGARGRIEPKQNQIETKTEQSSCRRR